MRLQCSSYVSAYSSWNRCANCLGALTLLTQLPHFDSDGVHASEAGSSTTPTMARRQVFAESACVKRNDEHIPPSTVNECTQGRRDLSDDAPDNDRMKQKPRRGCVHAEHRSFRSPLQDGELYMGRRMVTCIIAPWTTIRCYSPWSP